MGMTTAHFSEKHLAIKHGQAADWSTLDADSHCRPFWTGGSECSIIDHSNENYDAIQALHNKGSVDAYGCMPAKTLGIWVSTWNGSSYGPWSYQTRSIYLCRDSNYLVNHLTNA